MDDHKDEEEVADLLDDVLECFEFFECLDADEASVDLDRRLPRPSDERVPYESELLLTERSRKPPRRECPRPRSARKP